MLSKRTDPDLAASGVFQRDPPSRILLVAVVIPLFIWAINSGIMALGVTESESARWDFSYTDNLTLMACYVIFVAEVAVVAWCTGRYLNHTVLRWTVFLWCMVFVELLFAMIQFKATGQLHYWRQSYQGVYAVGYGLASAQLGLLIAWVLLGRTRLGIRVTLFLAGLVAVMMYVGALSFKSSNDWITILLWQAIATFALCGALRLAGFRILPTHDERNIDPNATETEVIAGQRSSDRVQFSIMNLMMWTLALAPIFAVARLIDWSEIKFEYGLRFAQYVLLATMLSTTSLVAIWSGIGAGHVTLRVAVTLIFTASLGAVLGYASNAKWLKYIDLDRRHIGSDAYQFWISWTVLAGFFYLAILLVMRATNQRLTREQKPAKASVT